MKRLLIVAAFFACNNDAASLSPFPCARDQTCPDGVACLPGTGCVRPRADVLCRGDVDCAGIAAAICDLGRCVPTCRDGAGCEIGRICTAASGSGVCLTDCAAGQACPAALQCVSLWTPGKSACLPAGVGFEKSCDADGAPCGPFGARAVCAGAKCRASCRDGVGCPPPSTCSANQGPGACL